MSGVLWCDTGGHAFPESDPERQHFTQTRKVQTRMGIGYRGPGLTQGKDGYTYQDREEVTTELDICGKCFAKQTMFLEASDETEKE